MRMRTFNTERNVKTGDGGRGIFILKASTHKKRAWDKKFE
jgi:hypothetical protein